ncbi:major facilitator superfamily transporter [Lophiotrema nucula]|uniref:Major facilitator superfamily transporter n=1 Tax=Lophiotrema nucula TaxID=690887 RepID=A0A6A5ZKL4_9PLEO|nr:major facilitator superfamily transporter [Lophiotrema nucula]
MSGVKVWLTVAALTLCSFLVMLDMSIIATAIPQITTSFRALMDVGWYGSSYLLASSAVQPLTGKLYLAFEVKSTFLAFLTLFELGSLLCGAASSSTSFIIGRAVSGLGASGLLNGALTIIAAAVPMHQRPALIGVVMLVGQIGMVGGPVLGGVLTQYASWRWCFYINLPVGAIAVICLAAIQIPDRFGRLRAKKSTMLSRLLNLDPVGFCLFASWTVMFLMALQWGGTFYPWRSAMIVGLFCGAAGTAIIFATWEKSVGDNAMFPYSMLRKRVVWSSCVVIFLFQGCALIYSYYVPTYFQAVKGVSPLASGVYNSPGIGSQMVFAGVSSVLVGKLGHYLPWSVASAIIVAVGSGLMSTLTPHSGAARWIGYQLLAGIGRGCGATMPMVAVQNILEPEQIPLGMSLVAFCQSFGGSIFLTLAQTIFNGSLLSGLRRFAPTVDAQAVIDAGASGIREAVKPEEVAGVLQAYNLGISREFFLAGGASIGVLAFSWGMGWHSVRRQKAEGR